MTHYGTPLFDSLMADCIAAGKTVFTEQSLAKARSSRCNEAFDLHVAPLTAAGPDGDGRWECSMYVANMAPQSRGRLTLRDSDPRSNPGNRYRLLHGSRRQRSGGAAGRCGVDQGDCEPAPTC